MFKVNPVRRIKFPAVHDDGLGKDDSVIEYSVTFDFVIAEDLDYGKLRGVLEDKTPITIIDPKTNEPVIDPKTKEPIETAGMLNGFYFALRTSLVEWDGIVDTDGNPLPFKDEGGKIIEANQKAVFEAIRVDKDLFEKILLAYSGHKSKN